MLSMVHRANGMLREDRLPARADELVLEPDGSERFSQIFEFLHDLCTTALAGSAGGDNQEAIGEGEPVEAEAAADVELQLYHSDLLELGFEVSEADEWIERLTVVRMLDASGTIQNPWMFEDPDNRGDLPISLGLDAFRAEIHAQLSARFDRWRRARLRLPDDIWDALPLTAAERDALEQNLVFNGHIDTSRCIVDRNALQALTPDTFDVTLPLYRHRGVILAALQGVVATGRGRYLRVGPEELRPLADRCIAVNAHAALSAADLDWRGRLGSALLEQIDSERPPIDLGPTFSSAQLERIWGLLRQIDAEAARFRLTDVLMAIRDRGILTT
jgi:hypothetical protein